MGQQVRKDKKCCGTCVYRTGVAKPYTSSIIMVESGFYEKLGCVSKTSPNRNI